MRNRFRVAAVLVLSLFAVSASAWFNKDWSTRKPISINTTPAGVPITAPVTEVPVLVRLHTGNFAHFLSTLDGGGDLRFMAEDDTTPLKFHVERWDAINELALVWVKVPSIAPNATTKVRLYFNNPAAVKAQEAPLSFDADTGLVYHFSETAGPPQDSTANANNALESTAVAVPASVIAGGVRFNGAESIKLNDSPSLAQTALTGFTFSAWVKIDAPLTAPAVLFERTGPGGRVALGIDGVNVFGTAAPAGGTALETPKTAALTPATWQHVALVVGPTRTSVYLNGVEAGFVDGPAFDLNGPITLGATADGKDFYTGELDEVEIARVARSADWLKLAHAGQGDGGLLVAVGGDETPETAGGEEGGEPAEAASPFAVILKTVFGNKEAIVEQVVIGICGVMAFVAFMVMITKFMFLSAAATATRKFLHAYEHLGLEGEARSGLDALYDKRKRYKASPLFRVYRQGIDEVRKRQPQSVGAAASTTAGFIDSKGMSTIKAALDAVMVREGQRLNAYMVLLTIAISGGPFIGLLGTVVGVMVTFGAIAATGDVNIAAIAPGMAAALLATVAGLGVAIPSLFGYNYLGSQVKNISADMYVFADEFLARINEVYGE